MWCGSCTAEVEFEFTSWAWVQATAHFTGSSFFYLLTYVNECNWVNHNEFWADWVYCFYEPGDRTRKPLPITVPVVAQTQAQVVNSNSSSGGKETQFIQSPVGSSFPIIHKVGIFVQLLIKINRNCLVVESVLLQIYICHDVLNLST